MILHPSKSTLFPTRRSSDLKKFLISIGFQQSLADPCLYVHAKRGIMLLLYVDDIAAASKHGPELDWFYSQLSRSEEHTSELQSLTNLVCRLLLEKKKNFYYD